MNLLLGADSLASARSGVGRMTLQIALAMRAHPAIRDMRLLVGDAVLGPEWLDAMPAPAAPGAPGWRGRARDALNGVPTLRAIRNRMVRSRLDGVAAAMGAPVVYFEPNMIAKPFGGITVAGFNDLSWLHCPGAHPTERVRWIGRRLPGTIRQARRFVAISDFTARGMAAELGIDPARIDVVPLAPDAVFHPMTPDEAAPALARQGVEWGRYVLAVSTLEPRKNFDGLLAAWLAMPEAVREGRTLVVVGARGWGAVLDGAAAQAALADGSLRLAGHVGDDELNALYAGAAAFAYVSHYEGFGLPLLEAMAAGAPVIAAATTACGETAGDAALLIDPADPASITHALTRVLTDPALAADLRQRGLVRAASFTWAATADALVQSFRRALEGPT